MHQQNSKINQNYTFPIIITSSYKAVIQLITEYLFQIFNKRLLKFFSTYLTNLLTKYYQKIYKRCLLKYKYINQ